MPEPLIDREAFAALTMNNAALQREATTIFFDEAPVYLKRLRAALEVADQEAWRQAAHGFKGAALGLGMTRAASVAAAMEKGAPESASLKQLDAAIAATRAEAALVIGP